MRDVLKCTPRAPAAAPRRAETLAATRSDRQERPGDALLAALLALLAPDPGRAGEPPPTLPDVVISGAPLPGTAVDAATIPGAVATLRAADTDLAAAGTAAGALASRLGSATLDDPLDDRFQPTLNFRGFSASPVLGSAQGIAVYQNGTRVNESFGDAVNWDLIPALAIERLDLVGANPVYGLNALGAAVAITMKNGFSHDGASASVTTGSFGERSADVEFGAQRDRLALYVGATLDAADGWRRFGSDRVANLYADAALHREGLTLDLGVTLARDTLDGQGAAPVQELALDRSLSFTGPQRNLNELGFVTLSAALLVSPQWSLQGSAYHRDYRQQVANGNTTGYVPCQGPGAAGLLCEPDALTPVTGARGQPLPDPAGTGGAPLGENDTESLHTLGNGAALQASLATPLAGARNLLAIGATLDAARSDFGSATLVGAIGPGLLVAPGPEVVTPEGGEWNATPVALSASTRYVGAYASDTLALGERAALTASARYNVATLELADERGTALSGDSRFERLNPALGATYRVDARITAYAGYAETNRAPTASEIECSDPRRPCLLPSTLAGDPPGLRQVVAHTWEAGLRGAADAPAHATLEWRMGLYRAAVSDDIEAIADSLASGYYRNVGDTRRAGLEGDLAYHARGGSAFLGVSTVDATYRTGFTEPAPSNPAADAAGETTVRAGDRLPGIPRYSLKAGGALSLGARWRASGTFSWIGPSPFHGDEANLNAPLPAYRVVGLAADYHPAAGVEFFVRADNVLNARYAGYGLYADPGGAGAPGVPSGPAAHLDNRFESPGAPFALRAGLRLTF
jgi:iron complex outermembrane receptor protein